MAQRIEIHFIDIVDGDCTAIVAKESRSVAGNPNPVWVVTGTVLIDGGTRAWSHGIRAYLERNGLLCATGSPISAIYLSHLHRDHAAGLGGFADADVGEYFLTSPPGMPAAYATSEDYAAASAFLSRKVSKAARFYSNESFMQPVVASGNVFGMVGPMSIKCYAGAGIVWPAGTQAGRIPINAMAAMGTIEPERKAGEPRKPVVLSKGDPNAMSMALLFEWGDFRYFTAGDLVSGVMSRVALQLHLDGKVPISLVKASHHGSLENNWMTAPHRLPDRRLEDREGVVWKALGAQAVIVPAGRTSWELPRAEMLRLFADAGLPFWIANRFVIYAKDDDDERAWDAVLTGRIPGGTYANKENGWALRDHAVVVTVQPEAFPAGTAGTFAVGAGVGKRHMCIEVRKLEGLPERKGGGVSVSPIPLPNVVVRRDETYLLLLEVSRAVEGSKAKGSLASIISNFGQDSTGAYVPTVAGWLTIPPKQRFGRIGDIELWIRWFRAAVLLHLAVQTQGRSLAEVNEELVKLGKEEIPTQDEYLWIDRHMASETIQAMVNVIASKKRTWLRDVRSARGTTTLINVAIRNTKPSRYGGSLSTKGLMTWADDDRFAMALGLTRQMQVTAPLASGDWLAEFDTPRRRK